MSRRLSDSVAFAAMSLMMTMLVADVSAVRGYVPVWTITAMIACGVLVVYSVLAAVDDWKEGR